MTGTPTTRKRSERVERNRVYIFMASRRPGTHKSISNSESGNPGFPPQLAGLALGSLVQVHGISQR